jgi:N-acyl-D-aspartate/D-glutamate deacylase
VGIAEGRVVEVGDLAAVSAARTIDATGLVVAPGFIDLHTHSDGSLIINPRAESAVRQGVTTEIVGNCGHSAAPVHDPDAVRSILLGVQRVPIEWRSFGEYLERLGQSGLSMNVGALVGHGTIRLAAMGFASRVASPDELATEKALLEQSLDEGAFGLSLGLEYAPGNNSDSAELVELAKVARARGRMVTSHVRNRDYRFLDAAREMLALAETSGARLQLSHFTAKYGAAPGVQAQVFDLVEQAVADGMDIGADMLPYVWGMSSLPSAILPPWAFEGGVGRVIERLHDPDARAKIKRYDNPLWKIISAGLWDRLVILSSRAYPQYVGRTVEEIARDMGREAYDALFELMLAEGEGMYGISWAGRGVEEADLEVALANPMFAVASDGLTLAPYGELADVAWHPTSFGWAARTLGVYVRERQVLGLEEAVRKMTSLPASRLGLFDRGTIAPGNWADLVAFDMATVGDRATVYSPREYAQGIRWVLVNGEAVIENGEHTGARPGAVLRP